MVFVGVIETLCVTEDVIEGELEIVLDLDTVLDVVDEGVTVLEAVLEGVGVLLGNGGS